MRIRFLSSMLVCACVLVGCGEDNDVSATDQGANPILDAGSPDSLLPDQNLNGDLGIDSTLSDMQMVDVFSPSTGSDCEGWQTLGASTLVDTLHRHLVVTYDPITPTPNFGGTPDRYTTARELMFTRVERFQRDDEVFVVQCIYTNDTVFTPPDRDPDDEDMNCEHLWPRARLDSDRSSRLYEHQQSDVHHLAPSRPSANSLRGSLSFGEVVRDTNRSAAPSLTGKDQRGDRVFEPQDDSKGDIARVIFYMSVRWGLNISQSEEVTLRRWHVADPVTANELAKNDERANIQGNRNPFIDCPDLVDRVDDFEAFSTLDTVDTLPFP